MPDNVSPALPVGKVSLVGAGPGDPEFLTIKAYKALQSASVVFVDDLVAPAIVELIHPSARVVPVGKRGGCTSTPQAQIEAQMLEAARNGHQVVRLKGGDPFIFGRGGEEAQVLQRHGIAVEVIHGITSGLAAAGALQVALTHREFAQGVVFVTGHAKPEADAMNWAALAETAKLAKLTLVIYMGVAQIAHIQAGLLQALPADTPVAIVQDASLPTQRHALGCLQNLQTCLVEHGLSSPSIIIVGEVLRGIQMLNHANI